jgi:RND superfamily putative drug exporter
VTARTLRGPGGRRADPGDGASGERPHDFVHAFFTGLGRFSVRFRWPIVIAWIVLTFAVMHAFPSLASQVKTNNTAFLPASVPSQQAANLASPLQRANLIPVPVVVARTDGGLLTPRQESSLAALETSLRRVPTVVVVRDFGVSPDGQVAQLQVLSDVAQGSDTALKALIDHMDTAIRTAPIAPGLQVHPSGQIADQVAAAAHNKGNIVELGSVSFILLLLFLIFRAALAPLVTLIPAFIANAIAGPVVGELAAKGVLQASSLSQIMMIVLILGAGTDYGLFLVFRVREEIRRGREPRDAVAFALSRVGESITFSAGTVIVALLSLLAATFGLYQSLGAPLAIGIGIMLLAGLTLQPALLAIFGRVVFWPSRLTAGDTRAGLWGRVSARVVRAPVATLAIGLAVFGALAVASIGNRPAGFGNALSAPAGSSAAKGDALLARHFPRSQANPTNVVFRVATPVWRDPAVLVAATEDMARASVFREVNGPLDPLGTVLAPGQLLRLHRLLGPAKYLSPVPSPGASAVPVALYEAYRSTAQYLSPDGRTFQFFTSLRAGNPGTTAALHAVPAVRAATHRIASAIGAEASGVAGEAPGLYDVSNVSDSDLLRVIPLAVAVIALLLGLVMRSLVAPLYLIASVALSYLAALGLAVLIFVDIGGSGGLTFILPFLMFLFLLALGEDYNILVMTRIREEARELPLRQAIARALTATGSTVTSAGLVLAGTFAVFALVGAGGNGGSQIRDVGFGLALGVVMDTFLVRTLLVPSTVALLGRWNWWPSRMSRMSRGSGAGSAGQPETRNEPPTVPRRPPATGSTAPLAFPPSSSQR